MTPEQKVSKACRALLGHLGFVTWSTEQGYRKDRGGTRMDTGIPDCCFAGRGVVGWIEFKAGANKPTADQKAFLQTWQDHGGIAFAAWGPEDVVQELTVRGILKPGEVKL